MIRPKRPNNPPAPIAHTHAGMPDAQLQSLLTLRPMTVLAQLKHEHACFWMVCGYLVFEYVRPQIIYPVIAFLPWSAMFALGALLFSFADKTRPPSNCPISKLIVLYGVIVLLSATFGYRPSVSYAHLSDYFNWVIIYFAITRTVNSRARFFLFFTLYMLCNLKMSQHGFITWAGRGFHFDIDGVGGAPGWFQNSGEFGIQLCIFIPLIAAFIVAVRPYCVAWVRYGLYFVPVTAVGSVIASSSRGALVGLVAASLWGLKTTKYFIRATVIGACLAGIVYFSIPDESKQRFENSGSDRTSLHRLDRWHKGWETMKAHPLLGIGHKNWEVYYDDHLNYGVPGTPLVHNIFVESGTEHGFLGLGTLVSLIIATFVVNADTRRRAKRQNERFAVLIAHGLDAATIGMIISSCFVTVLYYPYVWIQAAFVASLNITTRSDPSAQ